MNNHQKFTAGSSKLKKHRANSQTISSYPVRYSRDTPFSYSVSFAFVLLVSFCFVLFFLKLKIYILIHIRQRRRVKDKIIFTQPISENKSNFFLPSVLASKG